MVTGKTVLTPKRVIIVSLAVTAALLFLLFRLFWIQIVWGGELRRQAEEFRTQNVVLQPHRGNIYDCHRNEMVTSIPAFSVYVPPAKTKELRALADRIAPLLEMEPASVYRKISTEKSFVWVKHKVDLETAERLKKLDLEGVGLIEGSKREYKQGNMAAHVLGFVGDDSQGLTGLERNYDSELRGIPGWLAVESDATGQPVPQAVKRVYPSRPGHSLILTIDQTIQYFVERELDRLMSTYQPAQATILVMEPETGEVLAMGSRPTFDPERWNTVSQKVWEGNTATLYNYEPGSTLKMFVAAAALEEGAVKESDGFYDPGFIKVNGRRINCWKREGHGHQTFAQAVENSCNVVFMQVGRKLGKERLYKYLRGFGFGSPTGIDLPGEETGVLKPQEKTIDLDLATMCIGQSIAVTPVQLLTAVCAIANGGRLMKPHLVEAVLDDAGRVSRQVKPQVVRQPISSDTARRLSSMLEKVVLEGTGKSAQVEGYRIAGKTGTAQVPGPGGYVEGKYVASFAGFAPLDDPRVAVLVVMAEPKGGKYHGGEIASPAFQTIMRDTLVYLGIPEQEGLHQAERLSGSSLAWGTIPRPQVFVPDVVGFPLTEARWLMGKHGLVARASGDQGVVREQYPSGGSRTSRGSSVTLKINPLDPAKPPEYLVVPDLTGLTLKKTGVLLEALGLKLEAKGSGLAVKQQPAAGIKVQPGSIVKVEFMPEEYFN
jgi:stage V sporulation protein D (sporulation-specific penicillin-binding protein)